MDSAISMKIGAKRIIVLFMPAIATAVSLHNFLHLPPATGMMLGLGYLGFFSCYLKKKEHRLISGDLPLDMTAVLTMDPDMSHGQWLLVPVY
jgi:hypothetical protein